MEVIKTNEDIRDRIARVREKEGKSQEEFGNILGVTNSTISLLERKKRDPSERLIRDICREFNINDDWLRTGKGGDENMYNKMDSDDIAFSHFGYLMGNASSQKKAVLAALVEMMYRFPDDKWNYVFNQFENCLKETRAKPQEGD